MLNPDHPDYDRNPGDEFDTSEGVWVFGRNQYSEYYRKGPKDGTVICSRDYPHSSKYPYWGGGKPSLTFEDAAKRSKAAAKREYERAKSLVERYETDSETT